MLESLSKQERRILAGIIQGKKNKEIAAELGISENTVKNHCVTLYRKLGVRNRTEAAVKFFKQLHH